MKIYSQGDCLKPGRYTVHTRFERSVLLFNRTGRALFVVPPAIGPGPLNVVVARPHTFVPQDTLVHPTAWPVPVYDSRLPRLSVAPRKEVAQLLRSTLPRLAPPDSLVSLFWPRPQLPPFQQHRDTIIRDALRAVARHRLAAGARRIRGCGTGLTPSGDDFLAGWILACRLRRDLATARQIHQAARGTNRVANLFLDLAACGRIHAPLQLFLQQPTAAHARRVCAFGHTSGADLLCGLLYGLTAAPHPAT